MVDRFFFNILTKDVEHSKSFYIDLLNMHLHFDSDWFVILKPNANSPLELGILDQNSPIAPERIGTAPTGTYPTFVVENVDAVHSRAVELGLDILEPPTDMFYGQRRMLVQDPNGLTVDVSSPSAPVTG